MRYRDMLLLAVAYSTSIMLGVMVVAVTVPVSMWVLKTISKLLGV